MDTIGDETQSVEFKSLWKDDFLKIISSFANLEGGELFIGIDDEGNVIGVKQSKNLMEVIPNKISGKLGIIPSVKLEKKDKQDVIHIEINPSSVPISYNGKFYVRSGSTTRELRDNELAHFLITKMGRTWDDFIEERTSIEDIDYDTVERFKRLAMDRIPSISMEKDCKTVLEKLDLISNGKVKRAAVLLFGKKPQKCYFHANVRIGKFLTDTEILTDDRIEGNLFIQLEKSLDVLRTKYLKTEISFEGIHRRDILEYPYEALKEAIINALIHRDYLSTSEIQIRIYNDKMIIMNSGKLPRDIPAERLKTIHPSKPRNRLLAQVFYFAGLIEGWGRGTLKIVDECVTHGLPEPDFIEDSGTMMVYLYKDQWTEENLRKMDLNDRQIKAVMYMKKEGTINLSSYKELVQDVNEKTLYRDLINLVDRGTIRSIGEKKGRKYVLK